MSGRGKRWRSLFRRQERQASPQQEILAFDSYETRAPSAQNCVDVIPGWNTRFPDEIGVVAGNVIDFTDERIIWALERFGDARDRNVLEIGPMEGAHSALLERHGANVTAVEASKNAFLKCLITKEIAGLKRTRFLLGDCVPFLEENQTRYDLIVASGVLYHMRDPLRFLQAVASRTDTLYLWTSCIDEAAKVETAETEIYRREREDVMFRDHPVTLYRRGYLGAEHTAKFCGGIFDDPRWMDRSSLLDTLRLLGFTSIEIAHEAKPLPLEPCLSIFARKG
ncbi:class I SAM-dependent methyltransferase [Shinella sp. G-2]|uniref:class I SAM-dependent methyltransferase n=1 Tax=Shinella sp. G-2 TaxID=3133141 RepID=UPI003D05DAE8